MPDKTIGEEVLALLRTRRGHFCFESGHHGEMWLDLELLCLRPEKVRHLADQLAMRVARHNVEAVCGPLVEGAFVALMVAMLLGVPFSYSERIQGAASDGFFPVAYRVPTALRPTLRGKRVAIVNDVINAGSAVGGTLADLRSLGAVPIAMATLATLGDPAARLATDNAIALEVLASLPNTIWKPSDCPLCANGVVLDAAP